MTSPDPVSWLMIEPGWTVEDAAGEQLGRVEEVTGDSNADIFDGLSIALGMTKQPLYVASENVGEIVDGRVRLTIDRAAIERLGRYTEPPAQEEISGEKASLLERAEGGFEQPGVRPGGNTLTRRVLEWFGRAGRR